MTDTFLKKTAEFLHEQHKGDFRSVLVLSPNRRATLFLKQELQQLQSKAIWSPVMMTMDEWVRHQAGDVESDRLSCIYQLFLLWQDQFSAAETFENFYFWGQRLLDDFDEIDKYRIDSRLLFSNLSDEKQIEEQFSGWKDDLLDYLRQFWSSIPERGASDHPGIEHFYKLWTALPVLKSRLEEILENQGKAYNGMMYRKIAASPDKDRQWADFQIYFVGFNRLNRCEQAIMDHLKSAYDAVAIWNVEKQLLAEGSYNNAGLYVRKIEDGKNSDKVFFSDWTTHPKEVQIAGIQKRVGQAKWIAEQLARKPEVAEDTMIVLPDESMLLPILSALPRSIEAVNVSMGVSLKETPAYTLLEAYLQMHEHYEPTVEAFRADDVRALTEHPYFPAEIVPDLSFDRKSVASLEKEFPEALFVFFQPISQTQPALLFDHFLKGLEVLHQHHSKRKEPSAGLAEFTSEVLVFAHRRLQKLADIFREQSMELDFEALRRLIIDYFRNARIPFQGEPLRGLQILGPLEARNLDYSQLFVPGLNEGVFPRARANSLIPFHLRRAFGLPVVDDEIAESAYYFFMALSGSRKAHLIYNQSVDDLGAREISRFAQSIQLFPPKNWNIHSGLQVQEVRPIQQPPIEIPKTEVVLEAMRKDLQASLSPSKLNTLLECSLRYYLKYIKGIKEGYDTDRSYSPLNIGNLLHKLLDRLYKPLEESEVKAEDVEKLHEQVEDQLMELMLGELKVEEDQLMKGELYLLFQYVSRRARAILDYDRQMTPFQMMYHEMKLEPTPLPVEVEGLDAVRIVGIIDRVDRVEGRYRFSDYKTGRPGLYKGAARIQPFDQMMAPGQRNYHQLAIQLGLYALAKRKDYGEGIQLGHYVVQEMQNPKQYDHRFELKKKPLQELEEEHFHQIQEGLNNVLQELMDPEQPIRQTPHEHFCRFCAFRQFCKRVP